MKKLKVVPSGGTIKVDMINYDIMTESVYKPKLEELNNTINTLNSEIQSLNNRIEELLAEIDNLNVLPDQLKQQISDLENTISELNSKILELQSEVASLNTTISSLNNKITSLNSNIDNLNNTISNLESDKEDLNDQINTLNTTISNLESDKRNLNSQISNLESTINDLNNTISEKDTEISNLNNTISEKDTELKRLNDILNNLSADYVDGSRLSNYISNFIDLINFNKPTSLFNLFYYTNMNKKLFDFVSKLDTSNVTNMTNMFYYCNISDDLVIEKLPDWDTSKVTNMSSMFYNSNNLLRNLKTLSNFDTSNVTNMNSIFAIVSFDYLEDFTLDRSKLTTLSVFYFVTGKNINTCDIYFNSATSTGSEFYYSSSIGSKTNPFKRFRLLYKEGVPIATNALTFNCNSLYFTVASLQDCLDNLPDLHGNRETSTINFSKSYIVDYEDNIDLTSAINNGWTIAIS